MDKLEDPVVIGRLRSAPPALIDRMLELATVDVTDSAALRLTIQPYKRLAQWVHESPDLAADQREMRKWLDRLINGSTPNLLWKLISAFGLADPVSSPAIDNETGSIAWLTVIRLKDLRQGFYYCIASLIEDDLPDCVHRCSLKECQKYFVDWPGERGKAGQDARYCCKKHNDRDRSRRYRERKKAEKQK